MAPHPMRDHIVHHRAPKQTERDERLEAFALRERPRNQRRRDHGEHHLKHHEGLVRDRRSVIRIGRCTDAREPRPGEAADDSPAVDVRPERERIAPEDPLHADQAKHDKAVHDGGEDVLLADEAAIEESKRRRHQHH